MRFGFDGCLMSVLLVVDRLLMRVFGLMELIGGVLVHLFGLMELIGGVLVHLLGVVKMVGGLLMRVLGRVQHVSAMLGCGHQASFGSRVGWVEVRSRRGLVHRQPQAIRGGVGRAEGRGSGRPVCTEGVVKGHPGAVEQIAYRP